ncbi:MAG: ribosome small subunit-dependent GTPase A [Rubrivivax sp.]
MTDNPIAPPLRRIGLTPAVWQRLAAMIFEGAHPMRVSDVQRDALHLHDGEHERPARALPALLGTLAAQDDALAVGDWVLAAPDAFGDCWVHQRMPPLTQLARRLHDGRDKVTRTVIAANVDTALLVMGLDHDFNPRRLERYLALVRLAGISALVVLTKADLCDDVPARLAQVRPLLPPDVDVVALCAIGDEPARALGPWADEGRTLVLLGSSGAGKSTLTNALVGHEVQRTGGTRDGDGRGRHTTTARTLFRLPGGACIVDTPGLRTLRLDGESGDVAGAFDDIARLAPACRFRDCRHDGEPGCAVRGAVAPERLRNYRKLLREAQRDTLTALQRREQLAVWKQRSRAAREVGRHKRGDA